jgi:flagellar biosynthesis GTPase FlhF
MAAADFVHRRGWVRFGPVAYREHYNSESDSEGAEYVHPAVAKADAKAKATEDKAQAKEDDKAKAAPEAQADAKATAKEDKADAKAKAKEARAKQAARIRAKVKKAQTVTNKVARLRRQANKIKQPDTATKFYVMWKNKWLPCLRKRAADMRGVANAVPAIGDPVHVDQGDGAVFWRGQAYPAAWDGDKPTGWTAVVERVDVDTVHLAGGGSFRLSEQPAVVRSVFKIDEPVLERTSTTWFAPGGREVEERGERVNVVSIIRQEIGQQPPYRPGISDFDLYEMNSADFGEAMFDALLHGDDNTQYYPDWLQYDVNVEMGDAGHIYGTCEMWVDFDFPK